MDPIAQDYHDIYHNIFHNIYHKVRTGQGWQALAMYFAKPLRICTRRRNIRLQRSPHALLFVLVWHVHTIEVLADVVYLVEDVMLEISFQLVFRDPVCLVCARPAPHRCAQCGVARHCGIACSIARSPAHRVSCRPRRARRLVVNFNKTLEKKVYNMEWT